MSDDNTKVLVEIVNGTSPAGGGCAGCASAGCCGTTPEEEFRTISDQLADDLQQSFGEKVDIKYVNADETGLDEYPLVSRVLQMGYPYPITVINGEPKFAGGIMTDDVKTAIEEILTQQ